MEIRTLYVSIQSNRIQGDNTNKASFTKMHIPMIRKSILLSGLLCAAGFLSAQPFSFGIRGGYTLANFDVKGKNGAGIFFNSNKKQSLGGMHIGLEGRWELDRRWAVLAGLQYNRKGYRSEIFWPTGSASRPALPALLPNSRRSKPPFVPFCPVDDIRPHQGG